MRLLIFLLSQAISCHIDNSLYKYFYRNVFLGLYIQGSRHLELIYYVSLINALVEFFLAKTYVNGKKRKGEFRKGKPWNVKGYDKNGNIENEWNLQT